MGKYQVLVQTVIQKIKAYHAVSYFYVRLKLFCGNLVSAWHIGQLVLFSSSFTELCPGLISFAELTLNRKYEADLKCAN